MNNGSKCTVTLSTVYIRYEDCRRVYRHQDLPSEVETGELGGALGSECGVVTAAVERGRGRGREGEGGR